jgi:hypothetical protein
MMGVAEAMTCDDWFDVGWAMFEGGMCTETGLPPLNDMEAQRWWLAGFGAAWAAGRSDASVDDALLATLAGHAELLRQLRSHRAGWGSARVQ